MNGHVDPVRRAEEEVGSLRRELGALVGELDRRRREALDVRLQVQRHPVAVAIAAGVVVVLLGGLVAVAVRRRRRRATIPGKAREVRRAMARLLDRPDRVAMKPGVTEKVLAAAATAAAAALARRLVQRTVAPTPPPRPRARRDGAAAGAPLH
ncbi:MAG: hypothetical protein QM704_25850 [Anaeromyxobacteraceae bacterium]